MTGTPPFDEKKMGVSVATGASLLAEYQALRAHAIGPRDTLKSSASRRAAIEALLVAKASPALMSAWRAFAYWPMPLVTIGEISSLRRRKDVLASKAAEHLPELHALWGQLDPRQTSDYAKREALLATGSDLAELIDLARSYRQDLSYDHERDLGLSTIPPGLAREAGLWTETSRPILGAMLRAHVPNSDFLVFPYYRPGQTEPASYRAKRFTRQPKRRSYWQPAGIRTAIYYPPNTLGSGRLRDVDRELIWTEGEKKALCLDRMGYTVLALPGVWNSQDMADPKPRTRLHPWIREDVAVAGRIHTIAFDSNLRTNGQIRAAAMRLVRTLRSAGAKEVRLVNWPDEKRFRINGVDDLAYYRGDDAVRALIAEATPVRGDEFWMPAMAMAQRDISAAQKFVFGALLARANKRGIVSGVAAAKLAAPLGKSRAAVARILSELVAKGWLERSSSAAEFTNGKWYRPANAYRILKPLLTTDVLYMVDPSQARMGNGVALMLSMLRRHRKMPVPSLAASLGTSPRSVRVYVESANGRAALVGGTVWLL